MQAHQRKLENNQPILNLITSLISILTLIKHNSLLWRLLSNVRSIILINYYLMSHNFNKLDILNYTKPLYIWILLRSLSNIQNEILYYYHYFQLVEYNSVCFLMITKTSQ